MSLLNEVLKSGALPREWLEGHHPAGFALSREVWRDFDKVVAYQHQTDAMTERGDVDEEIINRRMKLISKLWGIAALSPVDEWGGMSLRHIEPIERAMACIIMADAKQKISQEKFTWWTMGDVPGAQMSLHQKDSVRVPVSELDDTPYVVRIIDRDYIGLMKAFEQQLVQEANASPAPPAMGLFEMPYEPFPALDNLLEWERLRLIIEHHGIWATFIRGTDYAPVYWRAGWHVQQPAILTMFSGEAALAVRVLLAGIWRDAKIVQERWATERGQVEHRPATRSKKPAYRNAVVLPRVIRRVSWASDEEREAIVRATHGVRAHYRQLQEGQSASTEARDNAERYGLPQPPAGYTFVSPHLRGGGEAAHSPQRIICRGLRTVKVALG